MILLLLLLLSIVLDLATHQNYSNFSLILLFHIDFKFVLTLISWRFTNRMILLELAVCIMHLCTIQLCYKHNVEFINYLFTSYIEISNKFYIKHLTLIYIFFLSFFFSEVVHSTWFIILYADYFISWHMNVTSHILLLCKDKFIWPQKMTISLSIVIIVTYFKIYLHLCRLFNTESFLLQMQVTTLIESK